MKSLMINENCITGLLLGHSVDEPYATLIQAPVVTDLGEPTELVAYTVFEGGGRIGAGVVVAGTIASAVLPHHAAKYAQCKAFAVQVEGIQPRLRGMFISTAKDELAHMVKVMSASQEPVSGNDWRQVAAERLNAGICETDEDAQLFVERLQKPMDEYTLDPLRLAYVMFLSSGIASQTDLLDQEKKALIYGDKNKGISAAELEHANFLSGLDLSKLNAVGEIPTRMRHLTHHLIGVVGEGGEAANFLAGLQEEGRLVALQDALEAGDLAPFKNLIEELADLDFYIIGALAALGLTKTDLRRALYGKLSARYKDGYSDKAAIHRDTDAEMDSMTKNMQETQ